MSRSLYQITQKNPDGTLTRFLSSDPGQPYFSVNENISYLCWLFAKLNTGKRLSNLRLTTLSDGTPNPDMQMPVAHHLVPDVWMIIISFVATPKDITSHAHPNRFILFEFSFNSRAHLSDTRLHNLILAVTEADEAVAEWIIEKNPNYLLKRNTDGITAFQKALCTHDDAMCAMMKKYFENLQDGLKKMKNQFDEIFPKGYEVHLEQQKKEAEELFAGIEEAFNSASPIDVTNALNHVPATTSELHKKIAEFESKLKKYILNNKTHNPYTLEKAFEIYDNNWDPWSSEHLCLFSQQIIRPIQKNSSKVCLQHYAEGIYNRATQIKKVPASRACRSFLLQEGGRAAVDVRSLDDDLNFRGCINIFGRTRAWAVPPCVGLRGPALEAYKICVEQKQQAFRTYAAFEVTPISQSQEMRSDVR